MRPLIGIPVLVLVATGIFGASLVATEWMAPFGKRQLTRSDGTQETITVFLMRSDFFRARSIPDLDTKVKMLVSDTPGLREVDVAESDMLEGSRSVYVWLIAGDRNLNLEMVRDGWFPGGTQVGDQTWKLLIPEEEDASFLKRLTDAEEDARLNHRGIWSENGQQAEANQSLQPTPIPPGELGKSSSN